MNSAGVGNVGPLLIEGPDRRLDARIAIDRPHNSIRTLLIAKNFSVASGQMQSLPGLHLKPLPNVRATLSGDVYAEKQGNALGMLGNVDVNDAQYGKISIAQAHARFGGGLGSVRVSSLNAHGSFGTLSASGTISGTNRVALEGRFAGSLSALSQLAGNLPARGSVSAPIALVYDNGRAIAQIHNAKFAGASVRGVPIAGLSATVGTKGKAIRVYAARANVTGGGHATAAGTVGSGGRMVVAVSNLNVAALRVAGIPMQSGRADFAATIRGSLQAPAG